jgi:hypothetical protein
MSRPAETEEVFVCYHCNDGECANCVGVPCQCDCPLPSDGKINCCFKGCDERGKPQDGFDFFACDSCLTTMELLIAKKARVM